MFHHDDVAPDLEVEYDSQPVWLHRRHNYMHIILIKGVEPL